MPPPSPSPRPKAGRGRGRCTGREDEHRKGAGGRGRELGVPGVRPHAWPAGGARGARDHDRLQGAPELEHRLHLLPTEPDPGDAGGDLAVHRRCLPHACVRLRPADCLYKRNDLYIQQHKFGRIYTSGVFPLPNKRDSANFYKIASKRLSEAGYEHYMIGSYCKSVYEITSASTT